jgi:NitT/TauT family transport system permease protein
LARLYPWLVAAVLVGVWALACQLGWFHPASLPSPAAVARGFVEELRKGRLIDDAIASLFRVTSGFTLAAALAIPLGLVLGRRAGARAALLPAINFFRSISPIAWIPFAIVWFGIGDPPAIFLIFLSSFLPLALATTAAVANVPSVHFRVALDYGLTGAELYTRVILPAALPQLITALRVTAGVSWMVVVAAEMIAVRSGLGFLIIDARNGLRTDLVVVGMIVIGAIGIVIDRVIAQLARLPSVRWGYER